MSASRLTAIAGFAAVTSFACIAGAVQQPSYVTSGLELAAGGMARTQRTVSSHAPRRAQVAWRAFRADVGGSWLASWDEATGVPSRIFGTGIEAPGSQVSEKAAASFAVDFLKRHQALLAPGVAAGDFVLVSNELRRGLRTVAFLQHHGGMRVLGGQLSFRFKNDRLVAIASEALPRVRGAAPQLSVDATVARAAAQSWVAQDLGADVSVGALQGPFVLPLVGQAGALDYRVVLSVEVASKHPVGRWLVYVDARSGAPVAREQTLRFAQGTVVYDVPVRRPGDLRADYPAKHVTVDIDAVAGTANELGVVTFPDGGPAQVTLGARSPFVWVNNQGGGGPAATTVTLDPGGAVQWSEPSDPIVDAQLNSFIHTQLVKDYARVLAPDMSWIDAELDVNVNANDECNAFYDGQSINFFRDSNQCENTGRLADVIYHEFGHGLHHHAIILGAGQFDDALSEGLSDYMAATMTGDPGMGRGFFYSNEPLRHIDPDWVEYVWPDNIHPDPHETGLIIAGALWDLRTALIAKYGEQEGVAVTDRLFYQAMENAADIPSMYVEVLVADDDDGNLENGTPNVCEIVETFGAHGLRTLEVSLGELSVEPPDQAGYQVSITVEGLFADCPGDTVGEASLIWGLRRQPGQLDSVAMSGGPSEFSGEIPPQEAGEVVIYRVEVGLSVGTNLVFPDNEADALYQMFVGEVVPLYCTDFEVDPMLEGWTHALTSGEEQEGADDWQWGNPGGTVTNGDPLDAFSGSFIFGNDLGHGEYNGQYQPDKTNHADSPVINVGEYTNIRVQYRRWLAVEDGFFDQARIYANEREVWSNLASPNENNADTHHRDREWRFHDVDVSDQVDAAGNVQIRFEIESDGGYEFGGWSLDDFCVVAFEGEAPVDPQCGNALLETGEACDDGNQLAGDGCDPSCQLESEPSVDPDAAAEPQVVSGGCGCRLANDAPDRGALGWLALGAGLLLWRRRRA